MKIEYRIILMILVLSQVAFHVDAQKKFGNEWINPSKTYLKLKVAENGIYKLTYEEMVAAGFINTKINGTDLQLINYGTDQALYVSDNDFGPGDHIEFYGEKNTIGLDSLLYADWRKDLLNPDYSLVNDLLKIAQNPYAEHPNFEKYARQTPMKFANIKLSCSS